MDENALAEIEARWKPRAEWQRDFEPVGDEDVGITGYEPTGAVFFVPLPPEEHDGHECVEYISDRAVGDALEEARKDIAALVAALRSR